MMEPMQQTAIDTGPNWTFWAAVVSGGCTIIAALISAGWLWRKKRKGKK